MPFKRSVTLGEQVLVKVSHVDPRQDMIQFQELSYQEVQPTATKELGTEIITPFRDEFHTCPKTSFQTPTRPSVLPN